MLPPDNFQETPEPVVAHRTSPTNIGLYLLSVAQRARLRLDRRPLEAADRLEATLATMAGMARYRGHFYNWYDTTRSAPARSAVRLLGRQRQSRRAPDRAGQRLPGMAGPRLAGRASAAGRRRRPRSGPRRGAAGCAPTASVPRALGDELGADGECSTSMAAALDGSGVGGAAGGHRRTGRAWPTRRARSPSRRTTSRAPTCSSGRTRRGAAIESHRRDLATPRRALAGAARGAGDHRARRRRWRWNSTSCSIPTGCCSRSATRSREGCSIRAATTCWPRRRGWRASWPSPRATRPRGTGSGWAMP